jgi:hypothetical protein
VAKRIVNLDTKEISLILQWVPPLPEYDTFRKKMQNQLKTIKIRSAKNKGMKLQKDFAEKLAETMGLYYSQTDDNADISSRTCGLNGEDIILRNKARELIPFSFEAKASESLDLVKAIGQAKANATDRNWAVVHRRKTLSEDIIIIAVDVFLKMLKRS